MTWVNWVQLAASILSCIGVASFGKLWIGQVRIIREEMSRQERWLGALRRAAPAGMCLECGLSDGRHEVDCCFYVHKPQKQAEFELCADCSAKVAKGLRELTPREGVREPGANGNYRER